MAILFLARLLAQWLMLIFPLAFENTKYFFVSDSCDTPGISSQQPRTEREACSCATMMMLFVGFSCFISAVSYWVMCGALSACGE